MTILVGIHILINNVKAMSGRLYAAVPVSKKHLASVRGDAHKRQCCAMMKLFGEALTSLLSI